MQSAQNVVQLASESRLEKIGQLIQHSLCGDWILRIEHTQNASSHHVVWQQWNTPFFAIANPEPVINSIEICRDTYPTHTIRLYAEKIRPEVRLVYWIHQPRYQTRAKILSLKDLSGLTI